MALDKRFLHTDPRLFRPSRKRFIPGIILGVVFAFVFYMLMYYFREIMRVMWTDSVYYDVLVLSRKEMDFYNVICAFIATIFGQSLVFTFWFNNPRRKYGRFGSKFGSIVSDLWPLNILSFWMLVQIIVVIGLLFFWNVKYEFGVYPDFNIYFILMIIVLFLQQWLTILRVFKRRGMKWMLVSAVTISAVSLGMSRINFTDYDGFNEQMQSKSIYYRYHIDWPTIDNPDKLDLWQSRYGTDGNIYVVNSKDYPTDTIPIVVINNMNFYSDTTLNDRTLNEVGADSAGFFIKRWQAQKKADTIYPAYFSNIGKYNLKINRNIPMAFVNKLKMDLSDAGVRKVGYAIQPAIYGEGETFRYYDDWHMLSAVIPEYYSRSGYGMKNILEESRNFRNVIDVVLSCNGHYVVNGKLVNTKNLTDTFKALILEEPDYVILYHIGDNDTFQEYIDVIAGLSRAVGELRTEYLSEHSRRGYSLYWDEEYKVRKLYPLRIVEITAAVGKTSD